MTVTNTEIGAFINAQTEDTTPDTANDFVLTYDASATAVKKVALANIAGSPPAAGAGCRVYNNADISISTGVATALTFNSEKFDTDGFHSISSDTSRITIPAGQAGVYLITGTVMFDVNGTGQRMLQIKLNNTTLIGVAGQGPASGIYHTLNASAIYNLAETDYVELLAYQESGGSLAVKYFDERTPVFSAYKLG